jgi:hypothetical protein
VNPRIASNRRRATYTTHSNVVFFAKPSQQAREEARIAELLGPAGLVFLRDLLAATP